MDEDFAALMGVVVARCAELLAMAPATIAEGPLRGVPQSGVYLFSQDGTYLYVGRTRRLRARLREHVRASATDAPFAFRLARESVAKTKPSYRAEGDTRRALLRDPEFRSALQRAKDRIRHMEVRWVAEPDPVRQALLEVYVAHVTHAEHNDFATS